MEAICFLQSGHTAQCRSCFCNVGALSPQNQLWKRLSCRDYDPPQTEKIATMHRFDQDFFPSKQIPAPSSIENSFQLHENFFHSPPPFFYYDMQNQNIFKQLHQKEHWHFSCENISRCINLDFKRSLCGKKREHNMFVLT